MFTRKVGALAKSGYSQSRGTDRISSELLSFVLCLSLCYAIVFMLFCYYVYCYCVALSLFVLSYVLIVCTVPLPPGVNPIAVDKSIIIKMLHFYNCILLKMSTLASKHVEEINIL